MLLRGDFLGGLTAAIVALPLALALGVASGLGPMAGIYGAITVGFFAALFGGTPTQISGPTGPMTVVMVTVLVAFPQRPELAFLCVSLAGVFQLLFGVFKFGRYIKLVPHPVVSGFMTGIGVIVIILELGHALGHELPQGDTLVKLSAVSALIANINWHAFALCALTLAVNYLVPKSVRKFLPAALVAIVVGSLLGYFVFPQAPTIGDIPGGLPRPSLALPQPQDIPLLVEFALMLAFLGAIDSLLTSLVADSITRTHHHSDKELMGQGVGNFFSGLLGGLPGAGATMRTMVNIRAGATSRLSGMIHALVLLAIVLLFADVAENIPKAVLAGILIKVGIEIIDWSYLKRISSAPRSSVVIMFLTLIIAVFVDLIVAVAVGVIASSLIFVARTADEQLKNAKLAYGADQGVDLLEEEKRILEKADGRIVLFYMEGPLSFGSARDVSRLLSGRKQTDVLIIDFSSIPFIDSTAGFSLEELVLRQREANDPLLFTNMRENVKAFLKKMGVLDLLPESHILSSRLDAFKKAEALLKQRA